MGKLVQPKVFLVGYTGVDEEGLLAYLEYTKQTDFLESWKKARELGLSSGECLCSVYAKLCYKTLILGQNDNVKRVRDIHDNLKATFDTAHGSVFEHLTLNFVVTDCSRVYTHEQVRHRPGWAYSQTSGRFCRGEEIHVVSDPILAPVQDQADVMIAALEVEYKHWCNRMGLNGYAKLRDALANEVSPGVWEHPPDEKVREEAVRLGMVPNKKTCDLEMPFDRAKLITSALRRYLPNGQANEMGMSCNIRALRHTIAIRTQRFAEWEIRLIFNQVYQIVKKKFPAMVADAQEFTHNGLLEIAGMRQQPYEMKAGDPEALRFYSSDKLAEELDRRTAAIPQGGTA